MTKNEATSRLNESKDDLRKLGLGGGDAVEPSSSGATEDCETSFRWPFMPNSVASEDTIKKVDARLRGDVWKRAKSQQLMGNTLDAGLFVSPKTSFETPKEVGIVTKEVSDHKKVGWMIWHFSSARARNMWLKELQDIINSYQCISGLVHVFIKSHLFDSLGSNPVERGKELLDQIQFFDQELASSEAKFEGSCQVNEDSTMVSITCNNSWIERIAKNSNLATVIGDIVFYNQVKLAT